MPDDRPDIAGDYRTLADDKLVLREREAATLLAVSVRTLQRLRLDGGRPHLSSRSPTNGSAATSSMTRPAIRRASSRHSRFMSGTDRRSSRTQPADRGCAARSRPPSSAPAANAVAPRMTAHAASRAPARRAIGSRRICAAPAPIRRPASRRWRRSPWNVSARSSRKGSTRPRRKHDLRAAATAQGLERRQPRNSPGARSTTHRGSDCHRLSTLPGLRR